VIVPAYNRADTIAATLDTITSQTGWPFEIVVIDDGSSDDTAAIARRHAPQARVVIQENQRGWLGSPDRCRTAFVTDVIMFVGSLVIPVRLLERVVYGSRRRIRNAWGWCLHQFGVGMKSVKTP